MKEVNLSNKDKYLFRIAFEVVSFLIGLEYASFRIASAAHYNSVLGSHFYWLYIPWKCILWFKNDYGQASQYYKFIIGTSLVYGFAVFVAVSMVFWFMIGKITGKVRPSEILSHFATEKEIEKAGLFSVSGILVGKEDPAIYGKKSIFSKKKELRSRYLKFNSNTHILMFAPTRSGKGVGFVIPNLLTYSDSVIVNDLKAENYELTAGFRAKMGQKIYYFNPTDYKSHCYNPLDAIRAGKPQAVKDAQTIANIIISNPDPNSNSSHWDNNARALLTGLILHVVHAYEIGTPERSIGGIYRLMSDPTQPLNDILENIKAAGAHHISQNMAAQILNKAEEEASGIISTMITYMHLWADPLVDICTRTTDFTIEMMRKEPSSLYLATPASDIDRTRPLTRIMLTQFITQLTEKIPTDEEKKSFQEILFMIDEFPRLGKMEVIEGTISLVAGYKVKFLLITQDLKQLFKVYTENTEITANTQLRIVYTPNDPKTAKEIAEYLGETITLRRSESLSGGRFAPVLKQTSSSVNEQKESLMTSGELMQLPYDKSLVILAGNPPVSAKKIFYYKEDLFKGKFGLPVPDTNRNHEEILKSLTKEAHSNNPKQKTEQEDTLEQIDENNYIEYFN